MASIDRTKRHYRRILEKEGRDDHPADAIVRRMPDVAEADRIARKISAKLAASETVKRIGERWTDYEDARFHQRSLREERFFDVGYEMGYLAGLSEARDAAGQPEASRLRTSILAAVAASSLSAASAATVLLRLARALVLKSGRAKHARTDLRDEG